MIAEILGYLLDIWRTFVDYVMILFYAQIAPEWYFILKIFLIAVFFLGSAFLSATVAELRRHKMKMHFFIGLVVPYIYPFVLALRLKTLEEANDEEDEIDPLSGLSNSITARFNEIKDDQEKEKLERKRRLKPDGQEEESVPETAEESEDNPVSDDVSKSEELIEPEEIIEEDVSPFTQRFFQELAVDSSGAKAGPFKLIANNGSEFKVGQIKNIQKDLASFEVEVNGKVKNIRIKYDNIKTFEKI